MQKHQALPQAHQRCVCTRHLPTRWMITVWLLTAMAWFAPPVSALNDISTASCSDQALAEFQQEVLALASINKHFQDLGQGQLDSEFSLSSIFTIDLLDSDDVSTRIQELNRQTKPAQGAYSQCQSPAFQRARTQRDEHARSISQIRLSYLVLPMEARYYLNSLISIVQQYQQRLATERQHSETAQAAMAQLEQQRTVLENDFETRQSPKERATLSESILSLDQQIEAIATQQKLDQKRLKKLTRMLEFSRALLIDYHLIYIDAGNAHNAAHGIEPFNRLVNGSNLQQLLAQQERNPQAADEAIESSPTAHAATPDELTTDELANLAALFIIQSRIYSDRRDQLGWSVAFSSGTGGISQALEHELKTLLTLPIANLHLKFARESNDYSYLSRNIFQSATNLITQIIIAMLLWWLIRRVHQWIHSLQRHLIKHHLTKRFSRFGIGLLRLVQPNAAWLTAFAFFIYLHNKPQEQLRDLLLLYDVVAILAFYLFVNTLTTSAISNTNSQAHLFVMKSRQQTIAKYCHHYALTVTLFSLFYIVLNSILQGGMITSLYIVGLLVVVWFLTFHLIAHFESELDTHLSKRVSEALHARYLGLKNPISKHLILPPVFIALQLHDLINGIHNRLLRFESYQALTAKFLKIRLEQSQSVSEPADKTTLEDTHYESWFLNRDLPIEKPALVIASPWIKELNTLCQEWLEEKQEENDLALIGECGIGKSTLIRQWSEQWDACNIVKLPITEKVITAEGIFTLIKDALGIPSVTEIAQFVMEQKSLEKTIIVIDEAHNLFLSDVGCFDAYKMLQSLISAKLENIFWIVAINQPSWIYLNDVFSRTYQFSNRLNIQRWSQQEIRELILSRHRASRRRLRYDELLLASTAHSETATRAAEARCFSLLWDQSAGIPAVALSIWVNAARHPARGQIEMGIPERPSSNTMLELSDDHLFVFAALITHETLNTQQAQAVTHLAEPIVRRALKLGLDQGFVIRKNRGRYTINSLWYLQLFQLLKRKNFLHE